MICKIDIGSVFLSINAQCLLAYDDFGTGVQNTIGLGNISVYRYCDLRLYSISFYTLDIVIRHRC